MVPLVAKGESIGLVELYSRRLLTLRRAAARPRPGDGQRGGDGALPNAQLYETARGLADRDPLTGFFNHRYLQERLNEEILRAQRTRDPLAILMIDLDDFKLVNDTLGHLFGDEVLVWVAEQIRGPCAAPTWRRATAATSSPSSSRDDGGRRPRGRRPDPDGAQPGGLPGARTAGPSRSAPRSGSPSFPMDGRTARDLISTADARLYRVKRSGGGAVEARIGRRHPARPSPRPLQIVRTGGTPEPGDLARNERPSAIELRRHA